MQSTSITADTVSAHGLSSAEYDRILSILGREPNLLELGIFSVMWSEHCSYKSSRVHLRNFPTTGPAVIHGPGENAGVVDIGDGMVAAFKMESHNHPSFIEPYQGAATGVGGILRDIFTMGARPIACLDSLRFGEIDAPRMRYLVDGVVRGISGYGNCIGVPTVGGETSFHPAYNGNILVNVLALGTAPRDRIFLGFASGVGNPVIYVGSKTGRDGIHGATMASAEFDSESEQKRPTVQVGDPFTEKLLLEACLELMQTDAIVGIQDMGAAGLTSSSFEMAGRAGTGIRLDLDRVPMREEGMTPYELMLSESQERMLIVAGKGREAEVLEVFARWELDAAVIGEVTDDEMVRLYWFGELAGEIPVQPISSQAPVYERPIQRPAGADDLPPTWSTDQIEEDATRLLLRLLASPNLCSRRWIYEQYDTSVRTNTIYGPERSDAAIIRIKENGRALALTADVNPVYCALDPYEGGKQAVAEAARNVACSGATPLAITDCLNFGSPERPEIMWQFAEAIRGISEACIALEAPVVSGNVSFYNETEGIAVLPTPSIGMVGLLESPELAVPSAFREDEEVIVLLGESRDELGGSELLQLLDPDFSARPPAVDLDHERRLVRLLNELAAERLLSSAHDISNGGLAIALAESSMEGIGCRIDLTGYGDDLDDLALLFSETQGRVVLSLPAANLDRVLAISASHRIAARTVGTTLHGLFEIDRSGSRLIRTTVPSMKRIWSEALSDHLAGATPDDILTGRADGVELVAHSD
ncbi:MAG: phosphoribosylformylglycinamidine synthase subunit PurL [Acidobacteria bacterium]|nr:phosphoribosylformylglycinamidine synthase subunit PurL [Acidobacteriota bacterium]